MVVLLHLADRSFANGNNLQIYETTTLEGGKIFSWHERLHSIYSGILSKVKTTSSSIFNKKSTIGFFESTKKWRLWGPSFCWTYCQTKNGTLFARSGTISKGLLPFPRTPSTRCALENLKINQVNLTWSGFKHPRFRRVSIDFLHIILDLFLGRIPGLGLSTSANTTLQKKMVIFCWDQCLGKRFTLRFSTISKKSLPKEIWTDYNGL